MSRSPGHLSPLRRATLGYVAYFGAVGAIFPYLPVYFHAIGLDLGAIGLLSALSAGTQLVASPLWGALNDGAPRSRVPVPAAALLAAGGAIALVLARGDLAVAGAVLVLAAGIAGIGPALDTRTLDILGPDRHRYGQIRAWGSASFVVVSWLTGWLIDATGVASLFAVYVPLLVVTAAVGFTMPRRPVVRRQINLMRGALGIVRGPGMTLFLVGALFVWTMLTAVNTYYSIQVVALGGANETVGLAWAVGAAVEVPIMFSFPRLARPFGTERLLLVGGILFAIRAAIASLAASPTVLVAVAPIEGAAFGLFSVAAIGFVSTRAPAGLAATAQGVYAAVIGLASILGAVIGGILAGQLGVPGLFAFAAAGSAVAAVLVWGAVTSAATRSVAVEHGERAIHAAQSVPAGVPETPMSDSPVGPDPFLDTPRVPSADVATVSRPVVAAVSPAPDTNPGSNLQVASGSGVPPHARDEARPAPDPRPDGAERP